MKKYTFSNTIDIRKKLYILSTLFLCISLYGTETTAPESEVSTNHENNHANQNNQNTRNAFDIKPMRKQKAHMQAGSFDTSFGLNGQGYFIGRVGPNQLFNGNCYTRAIAIQKNNKIVVTGTIAIGLAADYPLLVRYNENGVLDTTFGTGSDGPGAVVLHQLAYAYFNAVAIQKSNQKIIAAGGVDGKVFIARHNENGSLDQSFGNNGLIRPGINSYINAIAIQQKFHKIVVSRYNNYGSAKDTDILLIRYNEDGTLDTDFGTEGILSVREARLSQINAITSQEDKKIIAVGKAYPGNKNEIAIARYKKDGSLDLSFGSQGNGVGKIRIGNGDSVPYDVVVQDNGKIIVVGSSISEFNKSVFTIIRLDKNGFPDTSFGNNGIITITPTGYTGDNAYATSVALDNHHNIIVMGYTVGANGNTYFSLIRLTEDGILDTEFGHQGIESSSLSSARNVPNKNTTPVVGAMQDDAKKLVLAGNYSADNPKNSNQLAVARYLN